MSEARLTVDGLIYEGWKNVTITRSIEAIAAKFSLGLSERWPGQQTRLAIKPGAACQLSMASTEQLVINGYVDRVAPAYSDVDHSVTIDGRDFAGDLVDCSAVHNPGEWRNRTLLQIVREIVAPFNLSVLDLAGATEPFVKYRLEEGETAFEAIDRACRMRSVLPMCNEAGVLTLTRSTATDRATEELQRGVNILEASAEYDYRDRFSSYRIKSQAPGQQLADPEITSRVNSTAEDPAISRWRPLVMMAEHASTADRAKERAQWEANVRAARSGTINVIKQGWFQQGSGGLWRPNQLVRLTDDWLDISAEMLISGVTLSYDGRGYISSLTLRPPGAFTPEPPAAQGGVGWLN